MLISLKVFKTTCTDKHLLLYTYKSVTVSKRLELLDVHFLFRAR